MPKSRKNKQMADMENASENTSAGSTVVDDSSGEQVVDRNVSLADAALAEIETPSLKWHKRAAKAPLWMLNLASKSRILAGLAAIVVTALLMTVVTMATYTVLVSVAALMVPTLPNAVISTIGVSGSEVKATNDSFIFMGVMPTLFMVIALGVPIGLLVFRIFRWLVEFVVSLVSCAVVSHQAVSRMAHYRREQAPAKRAIKRHHLVDFAADAMKNPSGK